jgi:hypothetical protein
MMASRAEPPGQPLPIRPSATLDPRPVRWRDEAAIPPREWLYGRHLVRGRVSLTIAPSGVGKTALSISEALCMASGQCYLHHIPAQPMRVWLYNLEEDSDELERRWRAAAKQFGLHESDIADRLLVSSGFDQPLIIGRSGPDGVVIDRGLVDELVRVIRTIRIDVLTVDPFVSSHGLETENDNAGMDALLKQGWAQVAHRGNCAIDLIHHVRKLNGEQVTVDSARGGSAMAGAVRSVRCLNGMTKEEAERAEIDPKRAWAYVRIDDGKRNMSPKAERADWFQLHSVELDNGDSIGVARKWAWPADDELTMLAIDAVQARIGDGDWKASPRSKARWAGLAVAEALDLDASNPEARMEIKAKLSSLIEAGWLKEEEGRDNENRMKTIFVRIGRRAGARGMGTGE